MRILGIDPGLRVTGFGVVDMVGADLAYVASGTISTQHLDTRALPERQGRASLIILFVLCIPFVPLLLLFFMLFSFSLLLNFLLLRNSFLILANYTWFA